VQVFGDNSAACDWLMRTLVSDPETLRDLLLETEEPEFRCGGEEGSGWIILARHLVSILSTMTAVLSMPVPMLRRPHLAPSLSGCKWRACLPVRSRAARPSRHLPHHSDNHHHDRYHHQQHHDHPDAYSASFLLRLQVARLLARALKGGQATEAAAPFWDMVLALLEEAGEGRFARAEGLFQLLADVSLCGAFFL
jgi:hypothetical protein